MNILFVHQNFPGQYRHIMNTLAKEKDVHIVALGVEQTKEIIPSKVKTFRYGIQKGNTPNIHPWALETETKVIRGEACATAAYQLRKQGYTPDLICAHPGWGESLFIRDIWPTAPILLYQEFYYQTKGFDLDFDPEIQGEMGWEAKARAQMKNAALQLSLETSNWNVCPTTFQCSTFPKHWQKSISVIHDGIDTDRIKPNSSVKPLKLPDGAEIERGQQIITFANRTLEPYRGCHTFIRAIPELQEQCPDAHIIVVGETKGVSYGAACEHYEWKDKFLSEIEGSYDPSKVHFTGPLPYDQFLQLLQLSQVHVYLTYPFVLSWSLLEAMSSECAIVGSATAPVQELIQNEQNGLLVDFFDHHALAKSITKLIKNRDLAKRLGKNSRTTILKNYDLKDCVSRHIALMKMVACGAISRR